MNLKKTALVMFCDSSSLWWLRFLKSGYRHCFIALPMDNHWVVYEPLLNRTEITLIPHMTQHEVEQGFKSMGCVVIPAPMQKSPSFSQRGIWRPYTCVEAIRRVLGIPSKTVWTPYQLFMYLNQKGN